MAWSPLYTKIHGHPFCIDEAKSCHNKWGDDLAFTGSLPTSQARLEMLSHVHGFLYRWPLLFLLAFWYAYPSDRSRQSMSPRKVASSEQCPIRRGQIVEAMDRVSDMRTNPNAPCQSKMFPHVGGPIWLKLFLFWTVWGLVSSLASSSSSSSSGLLPIWMNPPQSVHMYKWCTPILKPKPAYVAVKP